MQRHKSSYGRTEYDYEHIVIDNCSIDTTVDKLRLLTQENKKLKVILNSRNFGHIKSPIYGMCQASGRNNFNDVNFRIQ